MAEKGERPAGYYSREAKAQRGEAWRRRRQEADQRRDEHQRERAASEAQRERVLAPVHAYALRSLKQIQDQAAVRAAEEAAREAEAAAALAAAEEEARAARGRKGKAKSKKAVRKARNKEKERAKPPLSLAEKWKGKPGTPETHEHVSTHGEDFLTRLFRAGRIDREHHASALEIAQVVQQIEGDVAVRTASLEARVDTSHGRGARLEEGFNRVRHHMAYSRWRRETPRLRLVLDMINGDAKPADSASIRLLVAALDHWRACVDAVWIRGRRADGSPVVQHREPRPEPPEPEPEEEPEAADLDEPTPLPPVNPAFLDERGRMKPMSEIADAIRARLAVEAEDCGTGDTRST